MTDIVNKFRDKILTRRQHNKERKQRSNSNNNNNNDNGAIPFKVIGPAAGLIGLCLVPLMLGGGAGLLVTAVAAAQQPTTTTAVDTSQAALGEVIDAEELAERDGERGNEIIDDDEEDDATTQQAGGAGGGVGEGRIEQTTTGGVSNEGTVTTATPEAGIVTTPLPNNQAVQESLTGTPMGPEVTNPGLNPRATLPQSVQMQEYQDFLNALGQNGYNFNDNGVVYTQSYSDGRFVLMVMGVQGNTDQPPAIVLDELATNWGMQMLTYAYNSEGQLMTVFLDAF